MYGPKLEKFKDFLKRISTPENKTIVQTCHDGFELIYKGDSTTNPYAQEDTIQTPDAIFTIDADTKRQVGDLDDITQEMVKSIIKKFNVSADEIHDNYLIFHTAMTIPQYFKHVMEQDSWNSRAYYDNEQDEYYAKTPQKYATTIKNRYRDSGYSSGG